MITERAKRRVEQATVRLTKMGGQGVLVPGRYILTATHCIEWNGKGRMALGAYIDEEVKTKDGRQFFVSVCTAEPVSDIASLEAPDNQASDTSSESWEKFDSFCSEVAPVPISTRIPRKSKSSVRPRRIPIPTNEMVMSAHILTHDNQWVEATVTASHSPDRCHRSKWRIDSKEPIKGGTSGGPVVDDRGWLVGLVSSVSDESPFWGMMPVVHLALPVWLWKNIEATKPTRRKRAVYEEAPAPPGEPPGWAEDFRNRMTARASKKK